MLAACIFVNAGKCCIGHLWVACNTRDKFGEDLRHFSFVSMIPLSPGLGQYIEGYVCLTQKFAGLRQLEPGYWMV